MADWKKLNKEFDDLIDNISDEDFKKWYDSLEKRRLKNAKNTCILESEEFRKLQYAVEFATNHKEFTVAWGDLKTFLRENKDRIK